MQILNLNQLNGVWELSLNISQQSSKMHWLLCATADAKKLKNLTKIVLKHQCV
jgi:hypothetical protein